MHHADMRDEPLRLPHVEPKHPYCSTHESKEEEEKKQ